ncbi:MAG: DUF4395 family protein [Actinomycetota bacterium]
MASAPAPIDPRGPRLNQAVLAVSLAVALAVDARWVVPLFAVVLFLGAAFGPRYGPVLRFYATVVRPRLGPPEEWEDPRPPRFSAAVGVVVLVAASGAFAAGAPVVGWILAAIVATLAGLAAASGLCVGCEIWVLLARWRSRPDAAALDGRLPVEPGTAADVVFTTPWCANCGPAVSAIERDGSVVVVVDATERPDLAERYEVRSAPTWLRLDAGGGVVARTVGLRAIRERTRTTV